MFRASSNRPRTRSLNVAVESGLGCEKSVIVSTTRLRSSNVDQEEDEDEFEDDYRGWPRFRRQVPSKLGDLKSRTRGRGIRFRGALWDAKVGAFRFRLSFSSGQDACLYLFKNTFKIFRITITEDRGD